MIKIKEGQADWSVMDFLKMAAVTFAIVATSATSGALAALGVVPKMEGTASLSVSCSPSPLLCHSCPPDSSARPASLTVSHSSCRVHR